MIPKKPVIETPNQILLTRLLEEHRIACEKYNAEKWHNIIKGYSESTGILEKDMDLKFINWLKTNKYNPPYKDLKDLKDLKEIY